MAEWDGGVTLPINQPEQRKNVLQVAAGSLCRREISGPPKPLQNVERAIISPLRTVLTPAGTAARPQ